MLNSVLSYRVGQPPTPPPLPRLSAVEWKPVRWLADAVALHEAAREAGSAAHAGGVGEGGGGSGSSFGYEMVATPGTVVGAGTVVAGAVGSSARGVLETAGQQSQNQHQNQARVYSESERVSE